MTLGLLFSLSASCVVYWAATDMRGTRVSTWGFALRQRRTACQGFAPIAIGLALTLIHLIGIPVTNTSVNPARSSGPAVFVGGWALSQLWLFWVAPIIGAAVAGSGGYGIQPPLAARDGAHTMADCGREDSYVQGV